jgi:hypothetical protein
MQSAVNARAISPSVRPRTYSRRTRSTTASGRVGGRPAGRGMGRACPGSRCSWTNRSSSSTGISRWPQGVLTVVMLGTTRRSIVAMLTLRASARADWLRARACLRGGADQLCRRSTIAGASCSRSGQDRAAGRRARARLLRLAEITPVRVPAAEEEAARDLVRAREDARSDLMRARHRLSKLLLRHGYVYDATAWTRTHDAWLRRQRFQGGPLAIVFDDC